eukprot:TRINITY_DN15068_c0_g1_i2.p1 TRINITY_DN15068_c0_g1~~TRINITY_DN15068_c0_g1_i2.p1  ORF type:complete len:379 (-),score=95.14 TRINITY_DN15068_c0_g1_i2:146-1282(-)
MYGHLDKQPPMTEKWDEGLHPYKPVYRDGKLYGRGSADDGYAIFSAITAIKALKAQNTTHSRIVILIEASEESSSPDLQFYVERLRSQIGTPSLIVCLDSGCGNYEQFWITTSLRGVVAVDLKVSVLHKGVHSGHGSGIVASSFRVLRHLLDRVEDSASGRVLLPQLHCEIPADRLAQAAKCAEVLGDEITSEFEFVPGARPVPGTNLELLLNRTWRPVISYTGADGIPHLSNSGNVLRTHTTIRLSCRVPPLTDATAGCEALKSALLSNPPAEAAVEIPFSKGYAGWNSPALAPWLEESLDRASATFYGKEWIALGEGGSIPFMGMLGEMFPQAQFVITGVLGPESNAHGPNEFLHVPFAKKLTCCVASILADFSAL